MKLIDLLSVCDENFYVVVKDTAENLLAIYDGRDSIPEEYNKLNVLLIRPYTEKVITIIVEA